MKKNMGSTDRNGRLGLAIIITALYFTDVISGIPAFILILIIGILLITSLFSFCPIYFPFGINSKKDLEQ